jgi:acyl phosphate:glycerol-3-phosphate acyltransferase
MPNSVPFPYALFLLALGAYLTGSIPFGLLIGYLKGIDLRRHGSRNIGATNAGRVLGKRYFVLVFLLDMAKGLLPTLVIGRLLFGYPHPPSRLLMAWLLISCLAIIGHNWPCWLKFKGGKGVSTSLGVVLAIYPFFTVPGLIAFAVWVVLVKLTHYVSLGSIVAAATFFISYLVLLGAVPSWSWRDQWFLVLFSFVMVSVLILRHSGNIRRLRNGTEHKFLMEQGQNLE